MSNIIHGHRTRTYTSPEYQVWRGMMKRCYQISHKSYKDYGGRGIIVCEHWHDFRNFFIDMGDRPEGKTLDRENVNGNYCKDNCKWANWSQQMKNKRKYANHSKTVPVTSDICATEVL